MLSKEARTEIPKEEILDSMLSDMVISSAMVHHITEGPLFDYHAQRLQVLTTQLKDFFGLEVEENGKENNSLRS